MSIAARPERATTRLPARTVARYATGSLGTGGFATLPGLVLAYFLTDNLGVAAILAGAIVTLAKIWDVVIDPVIGAWSDRSLVRSGSRKRFMLIGGFTLPVFFALTFAVPPTFGPVAGVICVLLAFLATATSFSLFQVPYIALPAELTRSYDERTRLLSWRVIALTITILLFGGGGPELRRLTGDPVTGYLIMGIVAGVVIGVGMLIAARTADDAVVTPATVEHVGIRAQYAAGFAAVRRAQPFRALLGTYLLQALATGTMLAGAQYVATWVMHSESAVTLLFAALVAPAVIATPGWELLSRRIGKERAFRIASLVYLLASASIVLALWSPGSWIYVSVAMAGVAYAGMQALPMAMLPDVISHDERQSGPGQAGTFTGMWTAAETIGFALGTTVVAVVLALTGYVSRTASAGAVTAGSAAGSTTGMVLSQPGSAVTGIVLTFSVLPAVLMLLSLITLGRYHLRRTDIDGTDL